MKLIQNFQKKISKIQAFFSGKKSQFKNDTIVWNYLNQIQLSPEESSILHKSFRTRIRIEENTEILQFRISPEDLDESDILKISDMGDSIEQRLQNLNHENTIEIQIKMSNCCGNNCYNCMKYHNS